jgi:hypothetical protein
MKTTSTTSHFPDYIPIIEVNNWTDRLKLALGVVLTGKVWTKSVTRKEEISELVCTTKQPTW